MAENNDSGTSRQPARNARPSRRSVNKRPSVSKKARPEHTGRHSAVARNTSRAESSSTPDRTRRSSADTSDRARRRDSAPARAAGRARTSEPIPERATRAEAASPGAAPRRDSAERPTPLAGLAENEPAEVVAAEQMAEHPLRSLALTALIAVVAVLAVTLGAQALSSTMPDYAAIVEKYSRSIAAISEQHNSQQQSATTEPVTLTVTFAGDCTLGTDEAFDYSRSFNAKFANEEPAYFLQNVADIFGADDLTVVNMEGTLTDSTTREDKTFAFRGDSDYAKVFSSSSVEAASMANNHSHDYGEQSYEDTIEALDAEGIETFGYDRIAYMDVKGVKVALVGVYELAENEGIRDEMVERITEAKDEGAQLTLVYIHWGVERESVPNDTQMMLGRAAIDAGADLVVGSHPHVIQGWEVYEGRYIVYSLGNFCFGGNDSPSDTDCMIFQQTFTVTGDDVAKNDEVDFIACSVTSASGYNNYQPTPATGEEKARIDAKIQASTDAIAERAAALSN